MLTLEEKAKKVQSLKKTVRNILFYTSQVYNCVCVHLIHIIHILIFDIYDMTHFM